MINNIKRLVIVIAMFCFASCGKNANELLLDKVDSPWELLGGADGFGANNRIRCIATDKAGNVYVGGDFFNKNRHYYVAKWDGTTWSELGGTSALHADSPIYALAVDAKGILYAAGAFMDSNYRYVAQWDGSQWSKCGGGGSKYGNGRILTMTVDAKGSIYAAGGLNDSTGYRCIAKWDGIKWHSIHVGSDRDVLSLAADPFGAVYVSDGFGSRVAGGYTIYQVDRNWVYGLYGFFATYSSKPFVTLTTDKNGHVYGSGNNNYCYCSYDTYIAHWDGSNFDVLGGLTSFHNHTRVFSLASDIYGNIYAAGETVYKNRFNYISKWDGRRWSEVGGNNSLGFNAELSVVTTDNKGNVYAVCNNINGANKHLVAKYSEPKQ